MENVSTTIFNFDEFIFAYVVNIRFICDGEIYLLTCVLAYLLTYLLTTRMTSDVLKLAKVPPLVISAIETLIQKWSTNLHLTCHEGDIQSNTIHYLRGIFQGDSLSVLLFILSVNPLSFLLKKLKGYQIGPSGRRDATINHLLFVDELKLIAVNLNLLKQ